MNKVIIGIIANHTPEYDIMKDLWIKNAKDKTNIEVYFLYGNRNIEAEYNVEKVSNNCFDFNVNCVENLQNLLYKTIIFFEWIIKNRKDCMIIRSNLSTVFELDKLYSMCLELYRYTFLFGGTFITGFNYTESLMSGANMIFSLGTIKLITWLKNKLLDSKEYDDITLSRFIFNKCKQTHRFYNMPRIDIVDKVQFNYCTLNDTNNVLCYRFKTNNRIEDTHLMKTFIESDFSKQILFNKIDKIGLFYLDEGDTYKKYTSKIININ